MILAPSGAEQPGWSGIIPASYEIIVAGGAARRAPATRRLAASAGRRKTVQGQSNAGSRHAQGLLGHHLPLDLRSRQARGLCGARARRDRAVRRPLSRARHRRQGLRGGPDGAHRDLANSRARRMRSRPTKARPTRTRSRRSATARCATSASSRDWIDRGGNGHVHAWTDRGAGHSRRDDRLLATATCVNSRGPEAGLTVNPPPGLTARMARPPLAIRSRSRSSATTPPASCTVSFEESAPTVA